jgi:hypothetical protein
VKDYTVPTYTKSEGIRLLSLSHESPREEEGGGHSIVLGLKMHITSPCVTKEIEEAFGYPIGGRNQAFLMPLLRSPLAQAWMSFRSSP